MKMRKKTKILWQFFLFSVIISFIPILGLANEKEKKSPDIIKSKAHVNEKQWKIEAGLHWSPIIPLGEMKEPFGIGMGTSLFISFDIPNIPFTRFGTAISYTRMISKLAYFNGHIKIIPIIGYTEFYYNVKNYWKPYFRIGLGGTYVDYKGKPISDTSFNSTASFDFTMNFGVGIGYTLKSFPKVKFILFTNYFLVREDNIEDFLLVSLGINLVL